jgi:hypothetical protein
VLKDINEFDSNGLNQLIKAVKEREDEAIMSKDYQQ